MEGQKEGIPQIHMGPDSCISAAGPLSVGLSVIKSAELLRIARCDVSKWRNAEAQDRGDDRDKALITLSRHHFSVLDLLVSFDTRENKIYLCVFSPLSLNAKLVGRLYESLAPAEGEVRGCISCASLVWLCTRACFCFLFFYTSSRGVTIQMVHGSICATVLGSVWF